MTAVLRRMRWWDVPSVVELEHALFPQPWSAEAFVSELAEVPATRCYVVAVDDDEVTGYAGLRAMPPDGDVQTIAVGPAAQGRGLGGELLDALLEEAVRRGCTQVFLEVRMENMAAISLYTARGFEAISTRRDYYGAGHDALVMRAEVAA